MKPPRTLYLYYYAIFAAVCISLLTCVSVEAATAVSPPKNTSRHGPTQKEAQQFHSTTVATNNEARAPITEITDNLLKKGTSFKNPITFENPDTTENLLAKYNSFKATETSDNQAATSQSNKKRRGNGIELDLNKKPKLSGSVEDLDEDTMLLMIVGAEKPRNQDTGLTREDLESYLLEEWEDHEATLDSIFDKPSDATFFEILKHPIPNIWLTFGKKISPDPCGLLLEKLTVRYGEDGLARRLVEAQKQSGDASDSLATQLMELKFEKWNQEKQSVRGILKNLKPRGLKDPALQMLFSYLSLMGKNPYAVFMKKLRKKPGEVELARLLALEEQDGGYLDIVKGLEFFQFTQWKLAGKYVIDAFKYLGINKGGPGVSHSSLWYAWVSYVKYLLSVKNLSEDTLRGMISETQTPVTKALHDQGTTSQVNKKRKRNDVELNSNMNTNLVESWWKNLNEGTMLLMIVVTKDHVVPGLKREDIESFLLTKWEKDGETFDGIFDKISDDEYVEILNHPTPQVWLTFGEKVGQNPYGVLLKKLTLRYGEDGLAKRLVIAQEQDGAATDSLAAQLVELQLGTWEQSGKSFFDVGKDLKIPKLPLVDQLKNPVLTMLFLYASRLGHEPYAMFATLLTKHINDVGLARLLALAEQDGGYLDIVKGLEFFQFTQWILAGKSVIDAFKYLGINKGGPGVSDSSLWYAWVSYVKYLLSVKNLSEDTLRGMISETQTPVTKALHDQGTTSQVNKKRKRNDVELNSNMNTNLVESWWKNLNEGTMLLMIVVTKDHVVPGLKREDIESFLLTKWEKDGETFDGIFDKISDDEYVEILNHPTPQVWLTFGEKVGQNPYGVLLKKLTLRYGEDGLAKRLVIAQEQADAATDSLAAQLVELQRTN